MTKKSVAITPEVKTPAEVKIPGMQQVGWISTEGISADVLDIPGGAGLAAVYIQDMTAIGAMIKSSNELQVGALQVALGALLVSAGVKYNDPVVEEIIDTIIQEFKDVPITSTTTLNLITRCGQLVQAANPERTISSLKVLASHGQVDEGNEDAV